MVRCKLRCIAPYHHHHHYHLLLLLLLVLQLLLGVGLDVSREVQKHPHCSTRSHDEQQHGCCRCPEVGVTVGPFPRTTHADIIPIAKRDRRKGWKEGRTNRHVMSWVR